MENLPDGEVIIIGKFEKREVKSKGDKRERNREGKETKRKKAIEIENNNRGNIARIKCFSRQKQEINVMNDKKNQVPTSLFQQTSTLFSNMKNQSGGNRRRSMGKQNNK